MALALATSHAAGLPAQGRVARPVDAAMTIRAQATQARVATGRSGDDLAQIKLPAGAYVLTVDAPGDAAGLEAPSAFAEIPECAGRGSVTVDGDAISMPHGPLVVRLRAGASRHIVEMPFVVTGYEQRIACSAGVALGALETSVDGLRVIDFASPEAGGGHAVLYVPRGHDVRAPGAMLVGLHPWGGSMWTYAAMGELLRAADASDVVLLMPGGLGNSLYTARAEREVFRAITAARAAVAIEPQRTSVWGASMGGAGATTLAVHHPDAFAMVASFFGDSEYDLSTYVRSILRSPAEAHAVNSLELAANLRHVPTRLFHGEDDHVSPIAQSERLAGELSRLGYAVTFARAPGFGHSGALAAKFIADVVREAATARAPTHPARVTFTSARPEDESAYGVRLTRRSAGDAFVDVEYMQGSLRVRAARNVEQLTLARGALGAPRGCATSADSARGVSVWWD